MAEAGDGRSQFAVSILYRLGQGVNADEQSEFDWLTKAANANSSRAQFNLYVTFGQSTSRRKDTRQSLFWLYTSYYNNNARAEEFVRKIEKQGSEVFDLATIKMEALEWLEKNHPNAMSN